MRTNTRNERAFTFPCGVQMRASAGHAPVEEGGDFKKTFDRGSSTGSPPEAFPRGWPPPRMAPAIRL